MSTQIRVTLRDSTSVLSGAAVSPRLFLVVFGIVLFRSVSVSDVRDPYGQPTPVAARWLVVPRDAVETLARMEETDGTA